MAGLDQRIVITDMRIPFFRLVLFFIKAALAAIPAAIVVALIIGVLTAVIAGLMGDAGTLMIRRWTY
jgi:hypothetical protein